MARTVALALTVGLAAAALAGCSGQPGAAAVVDGTVITQAEVEQTYDELRPILADARPSVVLQALIQSPALIEAAADNGVGVSDDEAAALLDTVMANAGLAADVEWGAGSLTIAKADLAGQNLSGLPDGAEIMAAAQASLGDVEVEVNPQYGQLATETGVLDPIAYPWIAAQ